MLCCFCLYHAWGGQATTEHHHEGSRNGDEPHVFQGHMEAKVWILIDLKVDGDAQALRADCDYLSCSHYVRPHIMPLPPFVKTHPPLHTLTLTLTHTQRSPPPLRPLLRLQHHSDARPLPPSFLHLHRHYECADSLRRPPLDLPLEQKHQLRTMARDHHHLLRGDCFVSGRHADGEPGREEDVDGGELWDVHCLGGRGCLCGWGSSGGEVFEYPDQCHSVVASGEWCFFFFADKG